jgi:uncharacterized membrane protein SirB2
MEAFYTEVRNVHIAAALTSGGLFLLRALALNLFNAAWPMATPVRVASYAVDTILFTAAMMLVVITRQYPFGASWLTMKAVVILPIYIFLGYWALRSKREEIRFVATAGAVAAFLFIFSIARTHSPLGIFS